MFTGIVAAVGRLAGRQWRGGDLSLLISGGGLLLDDVGLGDSIAVNGVCLTVTSLRGDTFGADVSRETLDHSCLGELPPNSPLNLEKALLPTSRLGGHFVSGHVDGVGTVLRREPLGRAERLVIEAPAGLMRYLARKGSIAVDGASLTVNDVGERSFELAIIPHTQSGTIIPGYAPGRRVHLEVDIIARYLERLLSVDGAPLEPAASGLDRAALAAHGYLP